MSKPFATDAVLFDFDGTLAPNLDLAVGQCLQPLSVFTCALAQFMHGRFSIYRLQIILE